MNSLWNLIKKELKELLTPSSIISVLVVVILLASIGTVVKGEVAENSELKPVGYFCFDETGGDYTDAALEALADEEKTGLKAIELELSQDDLDDTDKYLAAMEKAGTDNAVIIPYNFNADMESYVTEIPSPTLPPTLQVYYNQTSTSIFSVMSTASGALAVSVISSALSLEIIEKTGSSEKALSPLGGYSQQTFFKGILRDCTPDQIYSAMSSYTMFVPIIVMIVITMIGSILISSMGNEKENKTLETLLTLPLNRTTIVAGKLIGSAIAGLVMGVMYMIGMYFYVDGLPAMGGGTTTLKDLGLELAPLDWIIVAVMMFLAILSALGMCMILGAFAKNYKAAQTMVLPISVLAMIPMFVTMFTDMNSLPIFIQVLLFIIPFTHPMTVMQNLMFGNVALVAGGLVYLVCFMGLMFFITVKLYKSDILLTGLVKKQGKRRSRNPIMFLLGK